MSIITSKPWPFINHVTAIHISIRYTRYIPGHQVGSVCFSAGPDGVYQICEICSHVTPYKYRAIQEDRLISGAYRQSKMVLISKLYFTQSKQTVNRRSQNQHHAFKKKIRTIL